MNSLSNRFMDICGRILFITPFLFLLSDVLSLPAVHALPGDEVIAAAESFSKLPPDSAPAITRAMLAGLPEEYQLHEDGNSFSLSNPSHGIDIAFTPDGLEVKSGGKSWGMALTGIGYSGSVKPVQKAMLINDNGRMVYQRGDVSEWYINSRWGVEQGFTIRKDPGGKDRSGIEVELTLTGDVEPRLYAGTLILTDTQGNNIVRYSGLQVFDAAGTSLPAHFTLAGRNLRILVDDLYAQYPVTIDPWIQQAKLTASDRYEGDAFGSSIAISGDTIVVGADGNNSAYVYARPANGWANMTQTAKLNVDFGGSSWRDNPVAISGDTIVVGAEANDSAYVFARPVGGWTGYMDDPTAKLIPSDGAQFKNFGKAVAISADTIVVGARYDNDIKGSVYVFVRPVNGWANTTQTAKLSASGGAAGDQFGSSVAISGDTIVVGACRSDTYQGSAYVFVKPSSGWADMTQTANLTADGTADYFGTSSAISGDTIVVGGNYNGQQGSAHVYVRPGDGWKNMSSTAILTASEGDFFSSVAISGNTIIVGAPGTDGKGSAYVFERPQNGWTSMTQTAKIGASGGVTGDRFGSSVATSGSMIAVGAEGGLYGSAYVFELGSPAINTEQWGLFSDISQGFADLTLRKKADGTITADGNWAYTYQGAKSSGSFTRAPVIISGKAIAITASGTATSPSAPPGYTTSPYTLRISGTAYDGLGSGTFTITFQTYGWPDKIFGNWQGTRTGGGGITPVKAKALPWLKLLFEN